ncbi:YjbH domain-containing protein [Photobacterium sp.]|uniref:YjbH domain-containing protein n=1 Tax=Photobacterium sp. TaxID=660 RepID=UPI00299D5B4F|nr:YjbH domain-containing protein [Photobacterium sp.]MDX1303644.1 YjbH domain-containing protein [Photobacterium sp.]
MNTRLFTLFSLCGSFNPRCSLSAIALALLPVFHAQADSFSYPEFTPSQSDFGGVGLMQMPTGRMAPEGEFNVSVTFNENYHHYTATLQLFPWLESTVRYTQLQDLLYCDDPSFCGTSTLTDKGMDFKFRLWEESYWLPETSVGVRDFAGTGLFDGEFIAANKHVGPLDVTLGVGWGYIGNSGNITNPFCKASDSFCERPAGTSGRGGMTEFDSFFKGSASVYGGLEYQSPWQPLRFKVEYDGNDYTGDRPATSGSTGMPQDSKFNYGVLYRLGGWGDLRASYERGNTWTFGFNLRTNFNDLKASWQDEPAPVYAPKTTNREISDAEWLVVADELHKIAGYENPTIYASDDTVTIIASQTKYRDRREAHSRAATVLANHNPDVSEYRLVETANHQPTTETRIDSEQFTRVANQAYIHAKVEDSSQVINPTEPEGERIAEPGKNWDVSIAPTLQQSIGSSEDFYLFNIGINAGASYRLGNHIEVGGSVYLNLYDNYDKFLYEVPPDGTDLKRVRTLVRQYINDNPVRLNNLQLTWMDNFGDNVYAQAYGGYLEMMFGGVGSELLYRPLGSNWAFGIDANYVIQRDPDSQFDFFTDEVQTDPQDGRPYRVQTGTITGHASAYYQPQWSWLPNTLFKVSAGKYLAEDKGVTIDFSKQFDSGVIAGVFATFTDLSSEEYGEGSYTKGFYISVPFDIMTVKPSNNRATISWLPLTRDGGQMVNRKYQLYSVTDARSPWYGRKAVN